MVQRKRPLAFVAPATARAMGTCLGLGPPRGEKDSHLTVIRRSACSETSTPISRSSSDIVDELENATARGRQWQSRNRTYFKRRRTGLQSVPQRRAKILLKNPTARY